MGLDVEVERRGQSLMLGDRKHRGERDGVRMMSVEQRQAGEEVRTSSDLSFALSRLENCAISNKCGLNFRIGRRQNII